MYIVMLDDLYLAPAPRKYIDRTGACRGFYTSKFEKARKFKTFEQADRVANADDQLIIVPV